jgi:hypothetical protein
LVVTAFGAPVATRGEVVAAGGRAGAGAGMGDGGGRDAVATFGLVVAAGGRETVTGFGDGAGGAGCGAGRAAVGGVCEEVGCFGMGG